MTIVFLQPHLTAADAFVKGCVDAHEGLCDGLAEIDRIVGHPGIEALAHEFDLLLLERRGDLDVVTDTKENRPGIFGKPIGKIRVKGAQIEVVLGYDRSHSGAPVTPRYAY